MKSYINTFLRLQNKEFIEKHTIALMEKELPQTNSANHAASDYIYTLLKEQGFEAWRHNFVSDGKKNCQDKIMPICFEVSYATLKVESEWQGERVIADYKKEPFSIIRFSTPTKKGGVTTRLITFEDMLAGVDVSGAFVLLPPDLMPTDKALRPILERGGIGLVSGTAKTGALSPDTVHWANNCTETNSWCVNANERDFTGFCVSPNTRDRLYSACKAGEVIITADTDSHRFEGEMPAVSALLKGESDKEFWVFAHTGEPLEDDNSAGVISAIHSLIAIKKAIEQGEIPPLKYSLRLLFAPELYGYAAFAEHFGGTLHEKCIGAISIDGIPCSEDKNGINVIFAPPAVPFYCNPLMEAAWYELEGMHPLAPKVQGWKDSWANDCFLSDNSVGLPTLMPEPASSLFWHNSKQRYGYIDYNKLSVSLVGFTATIAATVCPSKEKITALLPKMVEYASDRIGEWVNLPLREGINPEDRLTHVKNIQIANLRDLERAGVDRGEIESAVKAIEANASRLILPAKSGENELNIYADIYPKRLTVGVPHDFARIPLERRYRPFILPLMSAVFSYMNGEKSLAELIAVTEWEQKTVYTSAELADFFETLQLMAEYGYISL